MSDHAHTHALSGRPLLLTALAFIGFGLLELVVGAFLKDNATVVQADGLHNLADAAVLIGTNWLERKWMNSPRRGLNCCGVNRLKILLGYFAPGSYGIGLIIGMLTHGKPDGTLLTARQTSLAIWLGIISIGVNIWCHRGTVHHGHGGLSAHLKSDVVGATAIIAVALLVPFTASLNPLITVTAFNIMAFVAWKELRTTVEKVKKCDHRLVMPPKAYAPASGRSTT
ncbi:MAG: hypothetical protein JWN01_667 [Patescibacteria group bacterium]|jgi:Co/Zn/Cd efflux system component|nr:hypothetical protein [Patescibacteria group bacterium]